MDSLSNGIEFHCIDKIFRRAACGPNTPHRLFWGPPNLVVGGRIHRFGRNSFKVFPKNCLGPSRVPGPKPKLEEPFATSPGPAVLPEISLMIFFPPAIVHLHGQRGFIGLGYNCPLKKFLTHGRHGWEVNISPTRHHPAVYKVARERWSPLFPFSHVLKITRSSGD